MTLNRFPFWQLYFSKAVLISYHDTHGFSLVNATFRYHAKIQENKILYLFCQNPVSVLKRPPKMKFLIRNVTTNTWLESFNEHNQSVNWVHNKEDAKQFDIVEVAKVARVNAINAEQVLNGETPTIRVISTYTPKLPGFKSIEKKIKQDSMQGWCLYCGKWTHDSCEPDAHHYKCPKCAYKTVYAAEELLVQGLFK